MLIYMGNVTKICYIITSKDRIYREEKYEILQLQDYLRGENRNDAANICT